MHHAVCDGYHASVF
ncbi:chloramphenicol acetyltransferase [Paenibacillus thiaminolyticus]|nr:chloramphenicol acetyltransferase [Paenibacillus thiaminolyticus]